MSSAAETRSEFLVVTYLAFIGALLAYGIDASLPAFDQLSEQFAMDERNLTPSIIVTVYFFGIAAGQLVWGILGDRFGRRPILLIAGGLYAAGAAGAALAPNLELLLLSRFAWGFGAAALTVLRYAIARDLYAGDQMARVVSTFSAIFLLGPIFAPIVAEGLLLFGDYRTIFVFAVILAGLAMAWTQRFGETLDPALRRPLRAGPIVEAFVAISKTRVTRWIVGVQVFSTAAFLIWLGSSQPIIDRIYDRDSQFALFFGISGIAMAGALLAVRSHIDRIGSRTLVLWAASGYVVVCIAGTAIALATDGVPSVWAWFGWAVAANMLTVLLGPLSISLALEPMADKAGTASSLLGVAQFGFGSALAALVDRRIDLTVTPMIVGSLIFGLAALGCLILALRSDSATSDSPPTAMTTRV